MQVPLWFEFAHRQWPGAGFDYFLAQMRGLDDDRYVPSLFFGLSPVGPRTVKPPPAPSGVYPERGFAMLRAEESPASEQGKTQAEGGRPDRKNLPYVEGSLVPLTLKTCARRWPKPTRKACKPVSWKTTGFGTGCLLTWEHVGLPKSVWKLPSRVVTVP